MWKVLIKMKYKFTLLITLVLATFLGLMITQPISYQLEQKNVTTEQIKPNLVVVEVVYESTQDLIERLATENNFNVNVALRIADCESDYGLNKFNKHSSAKGVYQFIDKTWKNYCEGDVMNNEDNIRCFIKLYPQHPRWWQCKV